jgi:hypothetical protein
LLIVFLPPCSALYAYLPRCGSVSLGTVDECLSAADPLPPTIIVLWRILFFFLLLTWYYFLPQTRLVYSDSRRRIDIFSVLNFS